MSSLTSHRTIFIIASALFFTAVALLLLSANMQKGPSHDEHMYVAGGALLARDGLLPYRDYAYFQMPNLALVYGAIFSATDRLLLAARLLNTACALLTLGLLFYTSAGVMGGGSYPVRFLAGAGSAMLLLANPLFIYTSGLAWNHDLPALLALAAVVYCLRLPAGWRGGIRLFLGGAGLGLAVGTRLSFAPALFAFLVCIPFLRGASSVRSKLNALGAFSAGALAGLVPASVLFALARDRFIFDNVEYHRLNELYWRQTGYERAMTPEGKLGYALEVMREPGTLALLATFSLLAAVAIAGARRTKEGRDLPAVLLPLAVAASLLVGALVPTPSWYQYFYAPIPFVVLGTVYGLSTIYRRGKIAGWALGLFGLAVAVSAFFGVQRYAELRPTLAPAEWVPNLAHATGTEIKGRVGQGRVLTLSPVFPLEGGLGIYEELSAGPFGWRVGPLLAGNSDAGRPAHAGNLSRLLASEPPDAILAGLEGQLEGLLVQYAQENGFAPVQLSNGLTLLVRPSYTNSP